MSKKWERKYTKEDLATRSGIARSQIRRDKEDRLLPLRKSFGNAPLTQEEFEKKLQELNPLFEALEPYQGRRIYIHFRCKACGKIRYQTPRNMYQGFKCSNCKGFPNIDMCLYETGMFLGIWYAIGHLYTRKFEYDNCQIGFVFDDLAKQKQIFDFIENFCLIHCGESPKKIIKNDKILYIRIKNRKIFDMFKNLQIISVRYFYGFENQSTEFKKGFICGFISATCKLKVKGNQAKIDGCTTRQFVYNFKDIMLLYNIKLGLYQKKKYNFINISFNETKKYAQLFKMMDEKYNKILDMLSNPE